MAPPSPAGFTVWRIKGTIGCTMLPALLPRCPLCSATAWLSTDADAEHSPVGWALNEITVGVLHSPEREALFKDRSKWFDPRAVKQRG